MISPAQSPYPMSQQATVAAIHAQQQQHLILQAQLNAQQQQLTAAVIASGNPSRGSSIAGSPPLLARQDGSDLQGPNIPISVAQQAKRQFIKGSPNDVEYGYTSRSSFSDRQPNRGNPRIEPPRHYDENEGLIDESWAETDGAPMNKYHPYESEPGNISSNVRGLQRHILTVQHQMGSLSANSSFNKGNSAPLEGHRHSISTENISQEAAARLKQRGASLNENLEFSKSGNRRNFIGSQNSPPGSDRDTPISGKPEV
uniref:Uncharacterized protein n=1 Tax=Ciona savignyi TaxID=51511 RepID=H2YRZ4_CIOSA